MLQSSLWRSKNRLLARRRRQRENEPVATARLHGGSRCSSGPKAPRCTQSCERPGGRRTACAVSSVATRGVGHLPGQLSALADVRSFPQPDSYTCELHLKEETGSEGPLLQARG